MATHSVSKKPSFLTKKPKFALPKTTRGRIIAAVVALVVAGGASALALTGGANTKNSPSVVLPSLPTTNCPLTDSPAPGNVVPNRPVVAVKIGNEPGPSRPQSGLNEADVVFDTPAEGFIMRYVAVFQCHVASAIGPTRSLRWVDSRVVDEFGHPILAFAGGINPDVDAVMGMSWLSPANLLEGGQAAGHRTTDRSPPDNLYTSTTALYSLYPKLTGAPKPIFTFSKKAPVGGTKIRAFRINFSQGTDVLWKWDAKNNDWIHTYARVVDHDAATGAPVTASNIAVISATYTFGPFPESLGGSGDVQSQTVGKGSGYVLRNGEAIKVTWSRQNGNNPMIFTDSAGHVVSMTPGRTWVEIVPDTTFNSASTSLLLAVPKG
jgi:hypothetical protein